MKYVMKVCTLAKLNSSHLPRGLRMLHQFIESPAVVRLPNVAAKQERQQEAQPLPHPRVESFNGDVHVVSLAQRF